MRISINVVFALVALGGFLLPQAAQAQITLDFTIQCVGATPGSSTRNCDRNTANPAFDLREGDRFDVTVTATGAIPAGGFISAVITGADADINTPTGNFTANGRTGIRFNLSASRMSHAQTWTITDDMAREGTESKTLHLYHDAFITAGLGGTTVSVSLTPGSTGANRSRRRSFNIQESDESVLTPQISTSPAQTFGEGAGNVRFDIVLASGGASLNVGLSNVCWYVTFSETQTASAADFSGLTTLPTRARNTCSGRQNGGLVNAAGSAGQVTTSVATTVTSSNFFRVLLADDSLIEAAETLTLHLGGPTADPGISYGSVDLAIADNDGYTLTPVPPAAPVQEGSAPTWRVRYTADDGSRALASETTVTATITGAAPGGANLATGGYPQGVTSDRTATASGAGADFASATATCTIPATTAHNAVVNCALPMVTQDTLSERVEHYQVALSGAPAGVTVGGPEFHTIAASDPITARISAANYTATEGSSATVRVEFSAAAGVTIPTGLAEFRLLFDNPSDDNYRTETPVAGNTDIISPTAAWFRAEGSRHYEFTVSSSDDSDAEADDVQTWRLRGTIVPINMVIQGGDSGNDGTFTVTFMDDDPTSWTIRARGSGIQNADVNEGAAAIASPTAADTGSNHADTMYFRITSYEGSAVPTARGEAVITYCLAGTATGVTQAALTADPTLAHDYIYPAGYDPTSASAAHSAYQGSCTMGRGSITIAAGDSVTYRIGITLNNDDLNESDETIIASVVNATEAGYPTRLENPAAEYVATRTIKDDDDISVSIAVAGTDADGDATGHQVQEGGDALFTVTLDHASAASIDVAYSITNTGAGNVQAADYTDSTGGSVTIAAGQTTGTIRIALVSGDSDTGNENLIVTLGTITAGTGAGTVAAASSPGNSATAIVTNRAFEHTLTLMRLSSAATDATVVSTPPTSYAEDAGAVYFMVNQPGLNPTAFAAAQTVTWTVTHADTTGTSAADFTGATTGTLTFPTTGCSASVATCRFTVTIADDTVDEPDSEGFSIVLSVADDTADGGIDVGNGSGDITITDNDNFTIDIRAANTNVSEGGFAVVSLTPTVSAAREVTMDYDHLSSTAESGLTLTAATDDVDATLPTTGGMAGGDFGALRTGGAATMDGTTEGYTVTFPANSTAAQYLLIPIVADNLNEAAETFHLTTFTVSIMGEYSTGRVLPIGGGMDDRGTSLTFTIAASDAITASIARDAATYNEGQSAAFTVTLSGATAGSAAAITVPYSVTVTGAGYTLAELVTANSGLTAGATAATGSITIAAGDTSGSISIALPLDDDLGASSADQTLTVTLTADDAGTTNMDEGPTAAAGGGAVTRGTPNNAQISVDFQDAARTLTVTGPATIAENDARNGVESGDYTVTLTGQAFTASSTTVNWTVSNVDTENADFVAASDRGGTVTFASSDGNNSTKTFTLTVAGDNLNEADETFTVNVTVADPMGDGGTAYGDPATTAIDDNDGISVVFARSSSPLQAASVVESASFTVRFAFGLLGDLRTADVTVPFSFSGLPNAEYAITLPTGIAATATGGTVTLDSSNILATGGFITVTVTGNNLNEAARTLTLTGGTPSTAGAIGYASAAARSIGVEITDDDAITVSIARASGAGSTVEESGAAEFTVTLAGASAGSAAAITVPYTVSSSGSYDVSGASGSVTIPAGMTTADFTVNLPTDGSLDSTDPAQTVTVTIPAPNPSATPPVAGVTVATGGGSVTRHATNNAATVSVTFIDTVPMLTVTGPAGVTENDAGAGANTGNYTVTLTGAAFASETTVAWTVTNVTTEDADFVAASDRGGTVTFAATDDPSSGTVAKTFNIDVAGDNVNEASEIFSVNVTAPNARTTVGTEVRTTITDDDAITYSIAADSASVNEADNAEAEFTVTLSGQSEGDVTIPVSVSGTATSGDDYTAPAATVTVSAGSTTADLDIALTNDAVAEGDETIIATVAADTDGAFSKGAAAGDVARSPEAADQSATVTISANDALSVSIARKSGETGPITEDGTTSANFTVTVTGTSARAVLVDFSISGTNITAADYDITAPLVDHDNDQATPDQALAATATSGTLTIAAGANQTGEITIQASDDSEAELAETLSVDLGAAASVGAGTITSTGSATVGITDDDGVSATVAAAASAAVTEGGSFSIPVTLGAAHARDVVFAVDVTATAATTDNDAESTDYGAATGTTISSGTTGSIMIPAMSDTLNEGDETFVVAITATTTGRAGGPSIPVTVSGAGATQTLTIQDDAADAITVTITKQSPAGNSVVEGGDGTASTADVTFRIALTGGTRTAVVTVPFELGGLLDGEFDITSALDSATDTTAAAAVPAASATGGVVNFTLGGGLSTVHRDIGVNLIGDSLNEAAETLTLTGTAAGATGLRFNGGLGGQLGYAGGGGDRAGISITDDDAITYSIADASAVTEVDAGGTNPTMSFTVSLSGASAGDVTIPYTVTGTATSGTDFTAPGGTVTIDDGDTTETIDITVLADDLNEAAETIIITLQNEDHASFSKGAAAGEVTLSTTSGDNTATGTINDDDAVTLTLSGGGDVNEGQNATVTVQLSAEATGSVTVNYTIASTASTSDNDAESADYTNTSGGSITINTANTRTGTITIGVDNDTLNEGDETFEVRVANTGTSLTGSVTVSTSPRTFTIKDDSNDATTVTIARHSNTNASVGEDAAASFTVTLGGGLRTGVITVPVSFSGLGNAEYDITAPGGVAAADTGVDVTFDLSGTPGATDSQTITVNLVGDTLNEATETLTLAGANAGSTGLRIAAGSIAYANNGQSAGVSVTDDDAITYSVADAAAVTEVDAGGTNPTMRFTISLSGASAGDVTVPYTLGGTATGGGTDYTDPSPLSVTIAAGDTGEDIEITIAADNLNEGDETITVELGANPARGFDAGAVTRAAAQADYTATGTINDDDAVTLTLSGGGDVNEGANATVTVTLGAEATGTVTVNYTIGSTSSGADNDAEAADYTNTSGGSIDIDTSSTRTGTITIGVNDDTLNEGDETFEVRVANTGTTLPGGVSVSGSPRTFTIKDAAADAIGVTIAKHTPSGNSVDEEASVTFRVTLSSTGNAVRTADLVVPFTVTGDLDNAEFAITGPGTAPADTATSHTVTFPVAGATATDNMDITIDLHGDEVNEAAETLTVAGADAGATGLRTAGAIDYAPGANTASVSVTDDDDITVTVARTTPSGTAAVAEGTAVTFTVSFADSDGNATDSAGDIQVPWTAVMGAQRSGEGATTMAPDLSAPGVTATVASGRTTLAGTLTVEDGNSAGTVVITVANDGIAEMAEQFTFTITAANRQAGAGAASLGASGMRAVTVGISQNAAAVHVVSVAGPDANVAEGGDAVFTLSLPAITGANARTTALTVAYSLGGVGSGDYTHTGTSVTFPASGAGATSQTVTVDITDDALNEAAETITLTLGAITSQSSFDSVGGASASGSASATISASDPVTYAINDPAVTEGDGAGTTNLVFNVDLSGASAGDVTIPYAITGGDATRDTDYTAASASGNVTITAGAANNRATISLPVTRDNVNEADETVVITLGTGVTVGAGGGMVTRTTTMADYTGTGTLNDDDDIAATFTSASTAGIQEGETHTITVNLDHASAAATTVNYSIAQGGDNNPPFTHSGGSGSTGSITIAAGDTSGTFTVTSTPTNAINTGTGRLTVSFGTVTTASGGGSGAGSGTAVLTVTFRAFERFFEVEADDANTTEGDTVVFTVGFTDASTNVVSGSPARVTWTLSGVQAGDYSAPSAATGNLSFANNNAQTVRVTLRRDGLNEAAETLTLTLSAASGGGGTGTGITTMSDSVTIAASDPVALRTTAARTSVSEGGNAVINLDLGAVPSSDVHIAYTVGSTAATTDNDATLSDAGADLSDANSGCVTITALGRVSTGAITLAITDDAINEAAETFTVTITAAGITGDHGTSTIAAGGEHTFTIAASDPLTASIARASGTAAAVDEGGVAEFTVTLTGAAAGSAAAVTVPYTVTSSGAYNIATGARSGVVTFAANVIAAQTITLALPASATLGSGDADQTLTVALGAPSVGAGGGSVSRGAARAQVRVNFVDAARTLTVTGASAHAETDSETTIQYTVALGNGDTAFAAATTVTWTVTPGSAAAADFSAVTGDIEFPTATTFNVTVAGDNLNEAAETFTVQVSVADAAADGGTAYGRAAMTTITDDDTITATLSGGGDSVAEGGEATITVTLSGATHTADVVFSYNTDDAAGSLTLAPGTPTGTLTITAADDDLSESPETFTVDADSLTAATAGDITIAGPQMFTIAADAADDITVTVASDSAQAFTGGTARFGVTMSGASAAAVTVDYSVDLTVDGEAVTIPAANITDTVSPIAAGATGGNIAVVIPRGINVDDSGALSVTLTAVTVATGGGSAMLGRTATAAEVAVSSDDPAARAARVAPAAAAVAKSIGQLAAHAIGARLNFTGGNALNIAGHGAASAEAVIAWAAPFLQTGRRPTIDGLLRQFGFAFSIGGGGLNFWGGGDYTSTEGDHDGVAYDGDVSALHFGVDTNWNDGLLGVAISRSNGDTNFTAAGLSGILDTTVTGVHPYLTRQFNKTKLWATVGYGIGDADVREPGALALETDIAVTTAALGMTYEHDAPVATLAIRLSTLYSRSELDAAESAGRHLPKVTADSLRLSAGAEISRRFVIGVRPFLSLDQRHDSGDGDTGRASDLGGGVEWHSPTETLRLSAAKSVTASGPDERRINFTVHKTVGRLSINLNLTADSAGLNTANLLSGEWRF